MPSEWHLTAACVHIQGVHALNGISAARVTSPQNAPSIVGVAE